MPAQRAGAAHVGAVGGVFMLMTFVVFVGYGLFAASVRQSRDLAAVS